MTTWQKLLPLTLLVVTFMAGCSSPTYVDKSDPNAQLGEGFSEVIYQVHDVYRFEPPECVAVLPFKTAAEADASLEEISIDQTEAIRRAVYAHLAPQGKRDIEIPRVDFVLAALDAGELEDLKAVGRKLNCDALIVGEVTEYGSKFLAVYSRVAVGAKVRMVRAGDGTLLWEGEHVAVSHGGSIPLSPVGLAMGIFHAASNVNEEQVFRVIDDLARRLVKTIPDNRIAVLDEPIYKIKQIAAKQPEQPKGVHGFLASISDIPQGEQQDALIAAIGSERFNETDTRKLYDQLIKISPDDPDSHATYSRFLVKTGDYGGALKEANESLALKGDNHEMRFLTGRIYIKLGELDNADKAVVQAISLNNTSATYLNGLGYVNSLRGKHERALAAYRMAIERDPTNGYAYYNTGVTQYNLGDLEQAADGFYGAGLAYLKSGDYGQAEKSLEDLKGLAAEGLKLSEEIDTLETAIKALSKREANNV